jgi:hypothetical protein
MFLLIARLLILAAAGGALALGVPREWVEPLAADPDVALAVAAALAATWAALWRLAHAWGWPK